MQKPGNDQTTALVAQLCRTDADGAGLASLCTDPEAWNGALALLDHHRLAPWAWSRARRSGTLEHLPPPFIAALGAAHRGAMLAHFALLGELRRIEATFAANHVPVVALKGASLFTTLYAEPGLRPMEDLDFLVRPEHLWAAGESLAMQGYTPVQNISIDEARRTHFHIAYRSRIRDFRVELHWGLDDETFLAPTVMPDIWMRTSFTGGTTAPRLDPVAEFLYLCLHAAKHGVLNCACARTPGLESVVFDPLSGNRLIWLLDLKLIMEHAAIRLDEVRLLAVRWRAEAALHSGTMLAQRVFGPVAGWEWTASLPAGGVSAVRLMVLRRLARGLSRRERATVLLMRRLQKLDHHRDARPARGLDLLDLPFPNPEELRGWRKRHGPWAMAPLALARFAGGIVQATRRVRKHYGAGRVPGEGGRIPRTIWQTYKTKDLPPDGKRCQASWQNLNPRWQYEIRDDDEIKAYVRSSWGERMAAFHEALPLGVMKADLWRYLILCDQGGVYSDVDTLCLEPLDRWIDGRQPRGADVLVVALESSTHFCQWTFAATPGHPALKHVAAFLLDNFESRGIDTASEHFVHATTGPGIWTRALRDYLGAGGAMDVGQVHVRYREDSAFRESCQARGVFLMGAKFFSGEKVRHLFASRSTVGSHDRWPELARRLRKDRETP